MGQGRPTCKGDKMTTRAEVINFHKEFANQLGFNGSDLQHIVLRRSRLRGVLRRSRLRGVLRRSRLRRRR
jgi:hypothetical protein